MSEKLEALEAWLRDALEKHDRMCGHEDRMHVARQIAPLIMERFATRANGEQVERVAAAIGEADTSFSYSFNLTRLIGGEETHTLSMPGFAPVDFEDREEGYTLLAERRNKARAEAVLATLSTPAQDARERVKVLEEALEVGDRFVRACFSAWSCGEPYHRVKTMMDRAEEFQAALARTALSNQEERL